MAAKLAHFRLWRRHCPIGRFRLPFASSANNFRTCFRPVALHPPSLSHCLSLLSSGAVGCAAESRPPFGFAHFCEEVTFFALRFTINYFIGELLSVYISSAPARCLKLPPPSPHPPLTCTHTPAAVPCQKHIQLSIVYSCALPICLPVSPPSTPFCLFFAHICKLYLSTGRICYVLARKKKHQNKSNNNKIIIIII